MTDSTDSPTPRTLAGWLRHLFSLRGRVDRRTYAIVGFTLMSLKYVIDAGVVYWMTGEIWTPLDYLSPFLTSHQSKLRGAASWLGPWLALWTIPFMWIGATMTIRRAVDAGLGPWFGLGFFVPLVNYIVMIWLCFASTREEERFEEDEVQPVAVDGRFVSALIAVALAVVGSAVMLSVSVFVLESYGTPLFAGAPFVMGVIGGYVHNRRNARHAGETVVVATISTVVVCMGFLLFAFEGLICIAMAFPLLLIVAIPGALVGRVIALDYGRRQSSTHAVAPFLVLLLVTAVDSKISEPVYYECVSVIEIDAPPEVVWENVVSFSELPPPTWLVFRLGVAHPLRARIEGEGVGAIRHCEFSTGAFVEPVTRWEPGSRLSFDVASQPPPMRELSPYDIHPPHLDGFIRSRAGEFRLSELPGGRTRLEGSTWYDLEIRPAVYWHLWSDLFIHAIHERVLEHVKRLSEAG